MIGPKMIGLEVKPCAACGNNDWELVQHFPERPEGETDYGFDGYDRKLMKCHHCGHFVNDHGAGIDLTKLYDGAYWDSTYADKIKATFDRVMSLPVDQSDNRGRVAYIEKFWKSSGASIPKAALDIGSGLAVFPAVMREKGWSITALDPDPKAAEHARQAAGVEAIAADFLKDIIPNKYSMVTLNKVLEHVPDMGAMLLKVKDNLSVGGVLYLELPDGEGAMTDPDAAFREEFFVEHYCAFSPQSYRLLAEKCGFEVLTMEQLIEPSGKYTLRGFLRPKAG